jgi:anti-sigma factor RsiW
MMKELPMDHLSDELLSAQLDGQLDAATALRVAAHLADCTACAARYADMQEVRAALQTLRQVDAIPDFRLTAKGLPRRTPTTLPSPPHRPPAFIGALARGISTAALLMGVLLLAVALFSGLGMLAGGHFAAATSEAGQSAAYGCTNQAKCSNTMHPIPGSTTVVASHATPTPVATTQSPTAPASTATGTATSSPNPLAVPVEAGLGLILAIGGAVGLRRFNRQGR